MWSMQQSLPSISARGSTTPTTPREEETSDMAFSPTTGHKVGAGLLAVGLLAVIALIVLIFVLDDKPAPKGPPIVGSSSTSSSSTAAFTAFDDEDL